MTTNLAPTRPHGAYVTSPVGIGACLPDAGHMRHHPLLSSHQPHDTRQPHDARTTKRQGNRMTPLSRSPFIKLNMRLPARRPNS